VRAASWVDSGGAPRERRLKVRRRGAWAEVTVPRLGVHAMVVLRH
jgi:hypothetical protein